MSTYQCSVCLYICDLNLEVIEKFQANNYRLPHWKKTTICPWKFPEILPRNFWSNVKRQWTRKSIPRSGVIYGVSTKTES